MPAAEILKKIVATENEARSIYDEAMDLKDGFDDYLKSHIDTLRQEYYKKADEELALFEKKITLDADKKIEQLDRKLGEDLIAAKAQYEMESQGVITRMFRLAVGADDYS